VYALRTVILPFIWIFNPQLLLIDVSNWWDLVSIVVASTIAMCVFAAMSMTWFRVKCRWWELVLMAAATALLFRPDFFMDRLYEEYRSVPAKEIFQVAGNLPENDRLVMQIKGTTIEGEAVEKTVAVNVGAPNPDGRKRLTAAGLTITALGDNVQIVDVKFGSRAKKSGIDQGFDIASLKVKTDRPNPHWFYLPAFLLLAVVWWSQGLRLHTRPVAA
jgi:hypothetical protein